METARVVRVPEADVAEPIENILIEENVIRAYEIVDEPFELG